MIFSTLHAARVAAAVIVAGIVLSVSPAQMAAADDYVPVSGAGSTWSSNAIDQWRRNVKQYGMVINYSSTGSSDGRNQFKAGTVDFASSEIPYGLSDGGVVDNPPTRGFAYMPIVAGGTAFMYNLTSGTKQITNLRLSGDVLTKIFTGVITSWDDAAIRADNPGLSLPKRKIVPVVRSDGSGSTAQFSAWMASQYKSTWDTYCGKAGRSVPCGTTSNFPTVSGSGFIAQPGSQGVSGYVAQKANIGTITYVEYSYALKTGFPVAKILNKAGYYVEPTASNVAVALLKAKINTDETSKSYLTQILTGVYNNTDPRTYPLSSYSYLIVPTRVESNFTTAKGKTLGAFAYYFLCEGQQQAEVLGYSPLPINLVQAGLDQVRKIPGVQTQSIDIKKCHNPTFSANGANTLAANAPQPASCDKKGAAQCSNGTGGSKTDTPSSGGTTTDGSTDGSTTDGSTTDGGTTGGTATDGGTTSGGSGGSTYCESDTGVCSNVVALPVEVASSGDWGAPQSLMLAAVIGLIALVIVPPVVGQSLSARRKRK